MKPVPLTHFPAKKELGKSLNSPSLNPLEAGFLRHK